MPTVIPDVKPSTTADYVRLLVDAAPPITPATLERVAALFRAGT